MVLLQHAQPAHAGRGVEGARPCQDFPAGGVAVPLVLEVPDWWGQPGARLVAVPAVALVLGVPVSDVALCEANVGLLLTSVGVGHLRRVHHPFAMQLPGIGHRRPPRCPLHPPVSCCWPLVNLELCCFSC